jgi:RNA polymerase-binding transcription factor DksA
MNRMNDAQRDELTRLLERREADLQATVADLRASIASPEDTSGVDVRDAVEDGDARMMSSLELEHLRRTEDELREVRAARQRMREGVYGRCEECDEPIPFERLKARPEARLCIRHEEEWEKAHRPLGAMQG